MATSIRVSDETKEKLARLKREDESWNKFLERRANERAGMEARPWDGADKTANARETIERSRQHFQP
jgi:predicted CopG family antitoxin